MLYVIIKVKKYILSIKTTIISVNIRQIGLILKGLIIS